MKVRRMRVDVRREPAGADMADLSLDEVIRRRSFTARGASKRPIYGRGAGPLNMTFDARQKIGSGDVRQRLGVGGASGGKRLQIAASGAAAQTLSRSSVFPVKDAREKLGQKDARLRLRGRGGGTSAVQSRGGGASAMQDARLMINLRKQQQQPPPASSLAPPSARPSGPGVPHVHIHNTSPRTHTLTTRVGVALQPGGGITKVVDARDRLSLKRSVPTTSNQSAASLKITKTIQRPVGMTSGIRINVPSAAPPRVCDEDDDDVSAVIPNKQMKITAASSLQTRAGPVSLSAPITKVVKNDSYTPPSVSVPPARPTPRPPTQSLQPVSRTTVTTQPAGGDASAQTHTPTQPVFSPLEGTKITVTNLHPRVTEEDIVELFCVCGALKRARLAKVGVAEVVFVRKEDAVSAYRKYNNRCLDGQPMKCNLHMQGSVITSDQPILLRLSDTPGSPLSAQKASSSSSSRSSKSSSAAEVDPQTILKALFKSSSSSSSSSSSQTASSASETPAAHATAFRIKI
ncbi:polymerase delta-interacting protein 3 isoform X2 [Danio aesculapii]|uniref:polymerase delta-interacting protein 3 isoform X2 n=1 Tax=Danio aesculapii TaxID=1142201 RepID=UPI0024C06D0B|nr:polymerase delta-interacting protein 3 isoform X2 [Danio aesculapii]